MFACVRMHRHAQMLFFLDYGLLSRHLTRTEPLTLSLYTGIIFSDAVMFLGVTVPKSFHRQTHLLCTLKLCLLNSNDWAIILQDES